VVADDLYTLMPSREPICLYNDHLPPVILFRLVDPFQVCYHITFQLGDEILDLYLVSSSEVLSNYLLTDYIS
jgi:hypothetical protein